MKYALSVACLALLSVPGNPDTRLFHTAPPTGHPADATPAWSQPAFAADLDCDGHTKGFWQSPNGERIITSGHFLPWLEALHAVDANGDPFTTDHFEVFKDWIKHANASNMAYMLSAQAVAMQFNVLAGFVQERCVVDNGQPHGVEIGDLLDQASEALRKDGYTPAGDPFRKRQEILKNLLDDANNNLNWL